MQQKGKHTELGVLNDDSHLRWSKREPGYGIENSNVGDEDKEDTNLFSVRLLMVRRKGIYSEAASPGLRFRRFGVLH